MKALVKADIGDLALFRERLDPALLEVRYGDTRDIASYTSVPCFCLLCAASSLSLFHLQHACMLAGSRACPQGLQQDADSVADQDLLQAAEV